MSTGGYDERQGFGTVKTTIRFYKGKNPIQQQTSDSGNQHPSKNVEVARGGRKGVLLQYVNGDAESTKSQEETELLTAKKKVKELRKKIEESKSRAKAHMEKLQKATGGVERDHAIALKANEDLMYNKVMKESEKEKHKSRQLKVNMTSLLEEKSRAEKEKESLVGKEQYYMNLVKALTSEIEKCNEDNVLVELARLEAEKDMKVIETQRQDAQHHHSARIEETRMKINSMTKQTNNTEELQRLLALTSSEANVLGNELEEIRKIDEKTQMVHPDYTTLLLSTTKELEAAKTKLNSEKASSMQLKDSMDALRTEIKDIREEAGRKQKKEAKTELVIRNLNSKLLRGKAKVQAASTSQAKAETIVLNSTITLEKYMSDAEDSKMRGSLSWKKTAAYILEVEKIKSEMDLEDEKFQAALEELNNVISSEAEALQQLRSSTQKTMQNRASASLHHSRITISTFEYEYLTGSAERATDIANKKIAAAKAWVEALKASEKEILMKTESAENEKERRTKEEHAVNKTCQLPSANISFKPQLENAGQNFKNTEESNKQLRLPKNYMTSNENLSKSGFPTVRIRSASFSIKRRPKVMPNLGKFLDGKTVRKNMQAM